MRLHSTHVDPIVKEMVHTLLEAGDIETEAPHEVELDLAAVLNQYIRDEQEISDKAREMVAARGLPPAEVGRARKALADQRKMKVGDDAIDYLLDQLLSMLMNSNNVDEIYAEDHELRLKLRAPLRRESKVDEDLDHAVRAQLKHVQEGTSVWEVEYRRMMEDIKRRRGL